MAYKRRPHPEFSWSHSRNLTFTDCQRKYYYQYYQSHNGWEWKAPYLQKLTYRLKKLTNIPMLVGALIHTEIAADITQQQNGFAPRSSADLITATLTAFEAALDDAQQHKKEWEKRPSKHTMLHSVYYADGPSSEAIALAKDRIESSLFGYLNSQTLADLQSDPKPTVKHIDTLDTFKVNNSTIYGVPDLHYRRSDGTHIIVDWKTGGAAETVQAQLLTYALYVQSQDPTSINSPFVGRVEYISQATHQDVVLSQADIDAQSTVIQASIAEMKEKLHDPQRNIAKAMKHFPLKADTSACHTCPFYQLDQTEIGK